MGEKKYKNKYKIGSIRLKSWDYRSEGYYFITICTKGRIHFFGEIEKAVMIKNNFGEIAEKYWKEIPKHFTDVTLDEYIIMPDHIHGIIIISDGNQHGNGNGNGGCVACNTSTMSIYSKITPKPGSISTIIRSFKSACTNEINKSQNKIQFGWQSRFYDHIIRDEASLCRIRKYIINNVKKYKEPNY
ncbi:MAG: transposase [bacterium]